MRFFLFFIFLINCLVVSGQTQDSISQKQLEQELNEKFKKSRLTTDEFKQLIYEKSAAEEEMNHLEIKQEVLQQKSIIGDEKEDQQRMPETPAIILPIFISPKEIDSVFQDEKEVFIDDLENENNRLFGPSKYDSRIEPYQFNASIGWQQQIIQKSNAVGMILERSKLTQYAKDVFQIDDQHTLGKRYNLCPDEAFYSQPVVGVGTAWLYDTNKMITASHVFQSDIKNYVVIFGFQILNKNGLIDVFISKSNVYEIKRTIKKDMDLDLVAFELDRSASGTPLQWESSPRKTGNETEIYMMGYPTGLPLKVAMNASIVENEQLQYFYTSLDSFQGNSGSPVFNFFTHKVIGVLVSGEIDYKFNGNCNESPLCKYPYCKGEKVIRIIQFME